MALNIASVRALHYVYKIGDRTATIKFFKEILGMKVLRHEEFTSGCEASCNGPYDGKWSKTMIGYGPEDDHFVCELTYNYGISAYKQGNSQLGLFMRGAKGFEDRAKAGGYSCTTSGDGGTVVTNPDGYKFHASKDPVPSDSLDPVYAMALFCNDMKATIKYWTTVLGFTQLPSTDPEVVRFTCGNGKHVLQFRGIGATIDHAKAGGRIAFSCPSSLLQPLEQSVRAAGHTVLTPYLSLETDGKATVQVVILADPDGHEICFVGDEGFRQLSAVDPAADSLLTQAIAADDSISWFAANGGKTDQA